MSDRREGIVTLFPTRPSFSTRLNSVSLPRQVADHLSRKEYAIAGDKLARSALAFTEVFRLLSNCVPALKSYLFKLAAFSTGSASQQRLICHLYLQVALSTLSSLKDKRDPRSQFDIHSAHVEEVKRIRAFIREHTSHLNQTVVMKLINDSGEVAVFAHDALLAFGDYAALVDHFIFMNGHGDLAAYIGKLTDPLVQRQVIRYLYNRNTMKLTEFLGEPEKPPMDAVFDTFTELALSAPKTAQNSPDLVGNANDNFTEFFNSHRFTKHAHFHLYFIFMALLGKSASLARFLDAPEFREMDTDFIVSFLLARKMFGLAGDVYARVPSRHVLAVRYAMRESFEKALSLLRGVLKGESDARACWLCFLREGGACLDCDWAKLVAAAHASGCVTLDDIFPHIPPEMELQTLIELIANTVQASSDQMKHGEKVREQIEARADEQRAIVAAPPAPVQFQAIEKCFLCARVACDSEFDAFPCGHVVHVACWRQRRGGKEENLEASCPACGIASLQLCDLPFVDPVADAELTRVWTVP
jgi:hypothetical protein